MFSPIFKKYSVIFKQINIEIRIISNESNVFIYFGI